VYKNMKLSPKSLEAIIESNLSVLSPAMLEWHEKAKEWSEKKESFVFAGPQDWGFVEHCVRYFKSEGVSCELFFPWKATAKKVIAEILGIDGWHVAKQTLHGEGRSSLMRFDLVHEQRQENATLFYAPYRVNDSDDCHSVAKAHFIDEGWVASGKPRCKILAIDQNLSEQKGYELSDLENLCHELGHIMHFLRIKVVSPLSQGAEEMMELPGYTMEW